MALTGRQSRDSVSRRERARTPLRPFTIRVSRARARRRWSAKGWSALIRSPSTRWREPSCRLRGN